MEQKKDSSRLVEGLQARHWDELNENDAYGAILRHLKREQKRLIKSPLVSDSGSMANRMVQVAVYQQILEKIDQLETTTRLRDKE